MNVAIAKYARTRIRDLGSGLVLCASDLGITSKVAFEDCELLRDQFPLQLATYLRFMKDFMQGAIVPLYIETRVDVPPRSGLGGSSSLAVSLVRALSQHFGVAMTSQRVSQIAWQVERRDCNLPGGWQDHYAASYGGFNYMTSSLIGTQRVNVKRLRVGEDFVERFERSLILFFGGNSRPSEEQINAQIMDIDGGNWETISALHRIRAQSASMRRALLCGSLPLVASLIRDGAAEKSRFMVKTPDADVLRAIQISEDYGDSGAKICGAGANRFAMIIVDPRYRDTVAARISRECNGLVTTCNVDDVGAVARSAYI